MDLEDFLAYLSWREALVAVVVLLVLYVLFTFLRINRLRHESRRVQELSPVAVKSAVAAYEAVQEPDTALQPVPEASVEPEVPDPPVREPVGRWTDPAVDAPAEANRIEVLEQDVAQLRREIAGLRAELQAAREAQRREREQVKVVQSASPYYSEAMQMAMRGQEASEISVLCGISRAEAELVVALANNRDQPLE